MSLLTMVDNTKNDKEAPKANPNITLINANILLPIKFSQHNRFLPRIHKTIIATTPIINATV